MGCALNNYLNLENKNRTGMCHYYPKYIGRKAGVKDVKAPVKCLTCEVGLHEECYYTFHAIKEGVVLDLSYEIKLVRQAHKSLKKWKPKEVRYIVRRVQPDLHNGVEVPGNNSQDDHDKGDWEETSDESEAELGNQSC